jgi:protein-disulfide isomerase
VTYPADESALLPIQRDAAIRGDREASLTLVIFGDLTCPNTARFVRTIPQLERVYGDTLRVVFKYYPLPGRVGSMQAAEAAATARVRGGNDGFWKFVDAASKTPDLLDNGRLEEIAIKAGLPAGAITDGINKHTDAPLVERDIALGRRLGVRGTPVIFFNGRRIDGYQSAEAMRELLDAEKERVDAFNKSGAPADRVYATRVLTNITTSEGDLRKK